MFPIIKNRKKELTKKFTLFENSHMVAEPHGEYTGMKRWSSWVSVEDHTLEVTDEYHVVFRASESTHKK